MIVLESNISKDNYTDYVCEKFDLQVDEVSKIEIPMINMQELASFEWNIGVICGNSGSGKSTVLSKLGNIKEPHYDMGKAICSQFPQMDERESCNLLSSVGLSSVPIWLHKPNEISNGERARLDLCYHLANVQNGEIILVDEFTSVVNRDCGKSMSYALQRYVREKNLKVILATCHFDLFEFLRPDWIFNLNKQHKGEVDIERVVYVGDSEYESYKSIDNNYILTREYGI